MHVVCVVRWIHALLHARPQQLVHWHASQERHLGNDVQGWQAYSRGRKRKASLQQKARLHCAQKTAQEAVSAWQTYVLCRASKKRAALQSAQHRQMNLLACMLLRSGFHPRALEVFQRLIFLLQKVDINLASWLKLLCAIVMATSTSYIESALALLLGKQRNKGQ